MSNENTQGTCPRVAVVGVGGAGCNVVGSFAGKGCPARTIAINTDRKALQETVADEKIYICKAVLKGEGTRGDAELGRRCADIHREEIREALSGYDLVFIIGGLGGGTGTGAMPTVIDAATVSGARTCTLAISPFLFEGRRKALAKDAYQRIKAMCEETMLLDNDKLADVYGDLDVKEIFRRANDSISECIASLASGMARTIGEAARRMGEAVRCESPEPMPMALMMSA